VPQDRFTLTPAGDPGLNYLCAGYKIFFSYIDEPVRMMADLLRSGHGAPEVMDLLRSGLEDSATRLDVLTTPADGE